MLIILKKIKIHLLFYFVVIISIATGYFKDIIILFLIIAIHELGHILASIYYKWNIEKIIILPFGGITIFKEYINRPLKEEFMITIMGPLFQILTMFFIKNSLYYNYSLNILLFNLLPIIPLDGSKLMNIFLNKISSFKKSHLYTIYISYFTLFIAVTYILTSDTSLVSIIIFLFLVFKIIEEYQKHHLIFNKFLLERYQIKFYFKKQKIIKNIYQMKKNYKHLFYKDNKYYTEKEILQKRFDFKDKL